MTSTTGTDWALGAEARLRALLSEGETAEALYRRAIEAVKRTRIRLELARPTSCTANGCAARSDVSTRASSGRIADEMFTEFGMEAFAERARVELKATGEHARTDS